MAARSKAPAIKRSDLALILHEFAAALDTLKFAKSTPYIYNPLSYAQAPSDEYCRRYGQSPKQIVFIGMNPGPYGMAQTGVPFGEVAIVRDWLGITSSVVQPRQPHPKRPIEGFSCRRSEVSGRRLWGQIREKFGEPNAFFAVGFVINYCPLLFYDEAGKNVTPDKLPSRDRDRLTKLCDHYLAAQVATLAAPWVIGIGKYAAEQAGRALAGQRVQIAHVLHPSPASPAANRGWAAQFEAQMLKSGAPWPV